MPIFYMESSAQVKRYIAEAGTQTVNYLFATRGPVDSFITSHLTIVELEATAARAVKGRLMSEASRRMISGQFSRELGTLITVQPLSADLLQDAAEVAGRYALRAGDAIHIATAINVTRAAGREVVFLTSDRELVIAAPCSGLTVVDPQAADATQRIISARQRG